MFVVKQLGASEAEMKAHFDRLKDTGALQSEDQALWEQTGGIPLHYLKDYAFVPWRKIIEGQLHCLLAFPHLAQFTGHRPVFPIPLVYTHCEIVGCTRTEFFSLISDPDYRQDWQQRFSTWLHRDLQIELCHVDWLQFWQELESYPGHKETTLPEDFYRLALKQGPTENDFTITCGFAFAKPLEGVEYRQGNIRISAIALGGDQYFWAVLCECPGTHPKDWITRFRVASPVFENKTEAVAFAEALKVDLETVI